MYCRTTARFQVCPFFRKSLNVSSFHVLAIFWILLPAANQSAYREHHSTETVLLAVNEELFHAADTDSCSALLLLDLSAAFDTVEHSILIRRLTDTFGIGGTEIEWFLSYLSGRSQVVRTPTSTSEAVAVRSGVPQGSVLGPVLFLAYVLMSLYLSQEEAVRCLTVCISRAEAWFTSNGVKLNLEKSHLFFSSAKKLASRLVPPPIIIKDRTILPLSVIVDLGVTFDSHLSMNQHIFNICQKGFGQLRMLSKINKCLQRSAAQCLVQALVLSHLVLR